jgi:hypothetical protein
VVWCGLGRGGEIIDDGARETSRGVLYVRIWHRRCVYDGTDVRECIYEDFGAIVSNTLAGSRMLDKVTQDIECVWSVLRLHLHFT